MIICDTSALLAAYGVRDNRRPAVLEALARDPGPLVLSPFVLAELDYMVTQAAGTGHELSVLTDVAEGVYTLADFSRRDVSAAAAVVQRYADMAIGLADASIVILAERYRTTRLLTFDERHFRAIKPPHAEAFTILPADRS